jgi:hypothetical protein
MKLVIYIVYKSIYFLQHAGAGGNPFNLHSEGCPFESLAGLRLSSPKVSWGFLTPFGGLREHDITSN